jgi:hypothetical protein
MRFVWVGRHAFSVQVRRARQAVFSTRERLKKRLGVSGVGFPLVADGQGPYLPISRPVRHRQQLKSFIFLENCFFAWPPTKQISRRRNHFPPLAQTSGNNG